MMFPVNVDCLFLVCDLVCRKMPRTVKDNLRIAGRMVTKDEYHSLRRAIPLHQRFLSGDYRATIEELEQLRDACTVCVAIHQRNIGKPSKAMDFPVSNLFGREGDLYSDAYQKVMVQVAQGVLEDLA